MKRSKPDRRKDRLGRELTVLFEIDVLFGDLITLIKNHRDGQPPERDRAWARLEETLRQERKRTIADEIDRISKCMTGPKAV